MSAWRKEALKRIPELQHIVESYGGGSPTMLWKKLHLEYRKLSKQDPLPLDLLKRVWEYARWSMRRRDAAGPAAMIEFCEHLIDTQTLRKLLPHIMCRQDYEQLKGVLLFRNTDQAYQKGLSLFEP